MPLKLKNGRVVTFATPKTHRVNLTPDRLDKQTKFAHDMHDALDVCNDGRITGDNYTNVKRG